MISQKEWKYNVGLNTTDSRECRFILTCSRSKTFRILPLLLVSIFDGSDYDISNTFGLKGFFLGGGGILILVSHNLDFPSVFKSFSTC